ncbi:hypothetical protein [Marinomonas sp. THO17]|uniref:hypothetical protein n=1 Tax=Marinomonas sp. THO17 TaxID=3149048 RepID=UPI00336BD3F4
MSRRPRVSIPSYAEHIIQRANNRQPILPVMKTFKPMYIGLVNTPRKEVCFKK